MREEPDERTILARERTALANERTFLAWARTGLASVASGLAIIRFLTFTTYPHQITSKLIGCSLVILGILIFALSFIDYKNNCKKLKVNNGYAGSILFIGAICTLLIAISILLFFFVGP